MTPVDFKEANFTFLKPEGMTDDECGDLRVFVGKYPDKTPCIISKWQPNKEDIEAINAGQPIWVSVIGTQTPPVLLFTENPFEY